MKCRNTVVKYQSVLKFSLNFLKIFFKLSLNSAVPTESAHLCSDQKVNQQLNVGGRECGMIYL